MSERWDSAIEIVLSNGTILSVAPKKEADPTSSVVKEVTGGERHVQCQKASAPSAAEKPDASGWTGSSIWESSEVLAKVLSSQPERVQGCRVLELGTGCGLAGLAAGALGAKQVTLTDQVLFMAEHNLEANFGGVRDLLERFRLEPLTWGDHEQLKALDPPFDVILGADLMYSKGHHAVLADTIIGASGPGTTVLWVTPDGTPDTPSVFSDSFYKRLASAGFNMRDISSQKAVAKALGPWKLWGMYGRDPIRVIEMTMPERRARM